MKWNNGTENQENAAADKQHSIFRYTVVQFPTRVVQYIAF